MTFPVICNVNVLLQKLDMKLGWKDVRYFFF